MILGFFEAFLLTVILEVPIVVHLTRGAERSLGRRAVVALLAQLVTHPLTWFVVPFLFSGWAPLAVSALWSWAGEALVYVVAFRSLRASRAASVAAVANAVSLAAGLVLHGR